MEWKYDRIDHKWGWNTIPPSTNSTNPIMPFAWRLLTLILCGCFFIRAVTNRVQFNCVSLVKNRTEIEVRRGSYTPSVWNPTPDDAIRECNQVCKSVSHLSHTWSVVFWFVWVLWQVVLFKAALVEEYEESGVESSDQREGAVQCAHPVLQSSCCGNSLQG